MNEEHGVISVSHFLPSIGGIAKGTQLLTNRGERRVELLRQGMMVRTIESGFQPILGVISWQLLPEIVQDNKKMLPLRVPPHFMGMKVPYKKLILSPEQLIVADHDGLKAPHYLSAKLLKKIDKISDVNRALSKPMTFYHVILANQEGVLANGMWIKCLDLRDFDIDKIDPEILKLIYLIVEEGIAKFDLEFEKDPAKYKRLNGADVLKLEGKKNKNWKRLELT